MVKLESPRLQWFNDPKANANGTSLQGYTKKISINELEAILGQPEYDVDDKTSIEWTIRFADGVVATIYLYKYHCDSNYTKNIFHIGGHNKNVVSRINRILRNDK